MCFGRPTGLCGIRRIDNLLFLQKIRRTLTKHIVCLFIWINYCKWHICDFKSWWAKHPHPSVWCLFRRSKQLPRCLLVLLKEPGHCNVFLCQSHSAVLFIDKAPLDEIRTRKWPSTIFVRSARVHLDLPQKLFKNILAIITYHASLKTAFKAVITRDRTKWLTGYHQKLVETSRACRLDHYMWNIPF